MPFSCQLLKQLTLQVNFENILVCVEYTSEFPDLIILLFNERSTFLWLRHWTCFSRDFGFIHAFGYIYTLEHHTEMPE